MDPTPHASATLGFTPAVGDMPFTPKQRSLLSLASVGWSIKNNAKKE